MVPLSAFSRVEWVKGPAQIVGYNGYPAVRINGQAGPGYSSGDAIARDGAARGASCRTASASNGRASRSRRSSQARRRRS